MKILVTLDTDTFPGVKELFKQFFDTETEILFLEDYPDEIKNKLISSSDVLVSMLPEKEGLYAAGISFENVKFIQFFSAGYDHILLDKFPSHLQMASNQGAYAAPMAEHAVSMILALSKRLTVYHNQLAEGNFYQLQSLTKTVNGSTLGIIGFGSIGKATAQLLKAFNVRVLAINTTGKTTEDVDFIGTLKDVDYVLEQSDILLLSCPLNSETEGLISKQTLNLMKDDAILINVARGQVINEHDLYEHLKSHPDFYAGLDVWWVEPLKHGKFEINYPFFELPNLLGSPHNSAIVKNALLLGTEKAATNIKRFIHHENILGVIHR